MRTYGDSAKADQAIDFFRSDDTIFARCFLIPGEDPAETNRRNVNQAFIDEFLTLPTRDETGDYFVNGKLVISNRTGKDQFFHIEALKEQLKDRISKLMSKYATIEDIELSDKDLLRYIAERINADLTD